MPGKASSAISGILDRVGESERQIGNLINTVVGDDVTSFGGAKDAARQVQGGGTGPITRRANEVQSGGQQQRSQQTQQQATGTGIFEGVPMINASQVRPKPASARTDYDSLIGQERFAADAGFAPPVNLGAPRVQAPRHNDAQSNLQGSVVEGKKKRRKKKGGKGGDSSSQIQPLSSANVEEIRRRTESALSDANEMHAEPYAQPTFQYSGDVGSYSYPELTERTSENRKRKRGLGRGLADMLSPEQVRAARGQQLKNASRRAAERISRHQDEQASVENLREDAVGRIRDNEQQLLEKRRQDILLAARQLNGGQEILTRDQMIALGVTTTELEELGIAHLIPGAVKTDGIPDDMDLPRGSEFYQTYRRMDDSGSEEASPIERLSAMRDEEVRDQVTVSITDESEEIDESYDTFQGLANGVEPTEIESRDDRVKRMRESRVETQLAWLNPLRLFGNLFEAKRIEDRGFEYLMPTMSREANNAIANVSVAYHGLSVESCLSLVMARGGISYDTFGKMKPEVRDDVVIELCADIVKSMDKNGLPNNLVDGKPWSRSVRDEHGNVVLGGTRCFPFGYIPNNVIQEIRGIEGSPLSKMTMEQIRKMEWEEFMNYTLPAISKNMDSAQLAAYRNGMMALLELDGQDPRYFDIPYDTAMTMMQRMEDVSGIDDPAVSMAAMVSNEEAVEAARRAEAKYSHTPRTRYSRNEDGRRGGKVRSLITENSYGAFNNGLRCLSNYTRTMGALNIGGMVTAPIESALSEVETMEANAIEGVLQTRLERQGIPVELYRPTDYIVGMVRSDDALEAMQVMDTLFHLDGMGWDIVSMYQEGGYELSRDDLARFIKDIRGMNDGRIADFEAFVSNAEHFWSRFMTGEGMFERRDMQEWVTTTLQMMAEQKARGNGAGVFNARQMEEALQVGGARKFVTDMMFGSDVARDAYMFMGLNSFGSKNPLSHAVEKLYKMNGISQFTCGMFLDQFPTYGVNSMVSKVPFSNTLSYIGATLATVSGHATNVRWLKNAKNYQAGLRTVFDKDGNVDMQGFYDGLRRNLIYDYVHLRNKLLMTCIIYTMIHRMGGLGVPDDDDKKYMLEEYRIGGADGIPYKYAWWLDDILGVSVGAAFAQYLHDNGAYDRAGNHVEIDNETAASVMWYSLIHQVDGTAIMDGIDMVGNLDGNMTNLVMMMTDPEGYADRIQNSDVPVPGDLGEATTAFIEHYFVANTLRNVTPRFFNQLMPMNKGFIGRDPNADEKTAWSVWDTRPTAWNPSGKSKEEAMSTLDTTGVGYLEGRRRKDSQDNWLYGLYNDIFRLHWGIGDVLNGGRDRDETGYMYDEQATGTKTDDSAMMYMDMFSFDPTHDDDGNAFTSQEDLRMHLNEKAVQLIDYLDTTWGEPNEYNVQRALADGLVIPYQARVNALEYCYYMYDLVKDQWQSIDENVNEDEYWDFYYNNVKPAREYWIDGIAKGWHLEYGDNTIPSTAPKYVKVRSDYLTNYVTDTGEAATWRDYLSGNAHPEVYAYGNPKSELSPISHPRMDEDHAFNEELTPYWDVPGYTDYQAMADRLRGNTVEYGLNADQDLEQVYFGGQPDQSLRIPTDTGRATINLRNYRKTDLTELPEILRDKPTSDTVRGILGLADIHTPTTDREDDDTTAKSSNRSSGGGYTSYGGGGGGGYYYSGGGGGYYYSGGGGGGSSYNPRIYSSPRQVYSQRASGLSTRSPYKATSTYLRPSFYTSGSRMSYKRQQ